MIRIGGSCIGRYGLNKPEMTCAEIRYLQNNEHPHALPQILQGLQNNQYVIVNIDTYLTNSRWIPTEQELRNFVEYLVNTVKSYGATKDRLRFTYDNEPMEHCNPTYYINNLAIIHSQLAGRFELGGGNENMPLAQINGFYETLCCNKQYFEWLDIHLQNGFHSSCDIDTNINYYAHLKKTYGITKIACTEGSDMYEMFDEYGLLLYQIDAAERLGCSDYCFIFADWITNDVEDDSDLSMCINGKPKDSVLYNDFINIVKTKNPEVFEMYGIEINYVKPGSKNEETRAVQQIMMDNGYDLSPYGADGIYGSVTEKAIKQWQTDAGLKIDGVIGKDTWQYIFENCKNGMLRFLQYLARTGRYK